MTDPAPYRRSYWQTQPEYSYPPYRSTAKRAPTQPLVIAPQTLSEVTGPLLGGDDVKPEEADLTRHLENGQLKDKDGAPVAPRTKPAATPPAAAPGEQQKPTELGSKDDFQLTQAIAYLKGEPVKQPPSVAATKPAAATPAN